MRTLLELFAWLGIVFMAATLATTAALAAVFAWAMFDEFVWKPVLRAVDRWDNRRQAEALLDEQARTGLRKIREGRMERLERIRWSEPQNPETWDEEAV